MKTLAVIGLLCIVLIASAAADFEASCELRSTAASKSFPCQMYQQQVGNEYRIRIDICYSGVGPDAFCESIVQRFNRTTDSGYLVSSQMILGEPWDDLASCCQHDALGDAMPPQITPLVNEEFTIVRSDNFTIVHITEVKSAPANVAEIILGNWDNAVAKCPLACITEAEVVFNIDNSGSIDGDEFFLINQFVVAFVNAFTLSPTKTNLGIVLFGGRTGNHEARYYFPTIGSIYHNDDTMLKGMWDNAIGNTTWQEPFPWLVNTTLNTDNYTYIVPEDETSSWNGGIAFLELYMTPIKSEVLRRMEIIANGTSRDCGFYCVMTAIGAGMTLSRDLFYRNPGRPVSAAGESNGYQRLLITMADGNNNEGLPVSSAAAIVSTIPNITMLAIGITSSVDESEMRAASSNPATDYFFVASFSDFDGILTPLISRVCTQQSNDAEPCSAECAANNGLCTACGSCVLCLTDEDCPPCEFCSLAPFGSCVSDPLAASVACGTFSDCDIVECDPGANNRSVMCTFNRNDTTLFNEQLALCDERGDSEFNAETCECTISIGSGGDGATTAAAIAAAGVAGGLLLLLLLAVLAALLLLLLLAAVFIIVAVVIAAIAMLAFGITMAIPPSISGLEVTSPTQVVNDENPLAVHGMEWVESAVTSPE